MINSFLTLFISVLSFSSLFPQNKNIITILTKDNLSFKINSMKFSLKMDSKDFVKKFGKPENQKLIDYIKEGYLSNCEILSYYTKGIEVVARPDGKIKGYTFYILASDNYKPCNVITDKGIKVGFSMEEIKKILGESYSKDSTDIAGYEGIESLKSWELYYKYDENTLSFHFDKHKQLDHISINSDYLSYLKNEIEPEVISKKDEYSSIIAEYSGSNIQNTKPFNVDSQWEIMWNAEGDFFSVYLYSSDGDMITVLANQSGSGRGSSYYPKKGKYYLAVNAIGNWSIKIIKSN